MNDNGWAHAERVIRLGFVCLTEQAWTRAFSPHRVFRRDAD